MDGNDFIDKMCEYDLYYETFKDDPNDPFCHPPKNRETRAQTHQALATLWGIVLTLGALCVFLWLAVLIFR